MSEDCKSKLDFFGDFQLSKNGFNFSFKAFDEFILVNGLSSDSDCPRLSVL